MLLERLKQKNKRNSPEPEQGGLRLVLGAAGKKRIHIPHVVDVPRPQDVVDADDVLVVEAQQDLDLPQRALAVRLVLEGADLLDGDALAGHVIQRGAAGGERGGVLRLRRRSRVTGAGVAPEAAVGRVG